MRGLEDLREDLSKAISDLEFLTSWVPNLRHFRRTWLQKLLRTESLKVTLRETGELGPQSQSTPNRVWAWSCTLQAGSVPHSGTYPLPCSSPFALFPEWRSLQQSLSSQFLHYPPQLHVWGREEKWPECAIASGHCSNQKSKPFGSTEVKWQDSHWF